MDGLSYFRNLKRSCAFNKVEGKTLAGKIVE
jgi:hypothetical protein